MNRILRTVLVFTFVVGLSGALISCSCAGHSKKTTKEDAPQHSGHGCGHQH